MPDIGLEGSLGRVGKHTTSDTEDDLSTNDTGLGRTAGVTTVADKQTKGDKEEAGTKDDEDLEAADLVDDETEDGTGDDTGEGVEGGDASGGGDAKVESDTQDGKQVVTLHGPGKVEHASHTKGSPDGTILHDGKGDKRMRGTELPEDEGRDGEEADDEGSNNVSLMPLAGGTSGNGERNEDEGKDGDDENDANDVEEPKELDDEVGEAELLEGRGVAVKVAHSARTTADDGEADDEREGTDGVDDAPHANSPSPSSGTHDGLGDITTDPCVDDEWKSGDITEKETSTSRGDISNDDLDEENDHCVANLVDDGTGRELVDILSNSLDNGSKGVEKDGCADQFDTTKDISNLGGCGLSSSTNDGTEDIDCGLKSVNTEVRGSVGLVGVASSTVETVGVGDEEDAKEDEDAISSCDDLGDGLDTNYTGGHDITNGIGSVGWFMLTIMSDIRAILLVVGRRRLMLSFWRRHGVFSGSPEEGRKCQVKLTDD